MLSYEVFFPGRILGNTATIVNKGNVPVKFRIRLESSTVVMSKEQMLA